MKKGRLLGTLGIPEDVLNGVSNIEITGNSRMLIQGCKGVLLYLEDEIKLNLGKCEVCIRGDELSMTALDEGMAQVEGTILDVSFK